jgi:hypothetical protein
LGTWTVDPAPVTVTALGGASTFGVSPGNPGLAAAGLENGQGVDALTGLRNSFNINSSTSVGSYALNVSGSLANPNYVIAGTHPGTWSVTALRGPVTDGPPGMIPRGPLQVPPGGGGVSALSGLDTPSNGTHGTDPGLGDVSVKPGAPATSSGTKSPIVNTVPVATPAPVGTSDLLAIPFLGKFPFMSAIASAIAMRPCPAGSDESATNPALVFVPEAASGRRSWVCATAAAIGSTGIIDFALKKLNVDQVTKAIDEVFAELQNQKTDKVSVFKKAIVGTGAAITAGFVGWLLRGGALLSVLFSSMPVWRGFDPLIVVLRPKAERSKHSPSSKVDLIFDNARKVGYSIYAPRR